MAKLNFAFFALKKTQCDKPVIELGKINGLPHYKKIATTCSFIFALFVMQAVQ